MLDAEIKISYKKAGIFVFAALFSCFVYRNFGISQLPFQFFSGQDGGAHLCELLKIIKIFSGTDSLEAFSLNLKDFFSFLYFDIRRPPVFFITVLFLNCFFNNIFLVAEYVLPLIFLFLSMLFTFKISELFHKGSGVFSVLILSLFPCTLNLSRGISLYPLQNAFAVSVFYFFFKSDLLKNRKFSVLCGVFFALGLLSKEQFPIVFAGPLILFLFLIAGKKIKTDLMNIALAALVVFLLGILPFYIFQLKAYIMHEPFAPTVLNMSYQMLYYFKALPDNMGIALSVVFAAALFFHIRKRHLYVYFFMASWLFFVLFCSLYQVSGGSSFQWFYSSVFCPLFAVLIGVFLAANGTGKRKIILLIILIAFWRLDFPGKFNWPLHRAPYTYNVKDYIDLIADHTVGYENREDLRIGLLRDAWECVLPGELESFLRMDGYRHITGGYGYPNVGLFLSKADFDVFIYVTAERSLFWPTVSMLKQQVDSLLPSLKDQITQDDIEYLHKRSQYLTLATTLPYVIKYDGKEYYTRIFLGTKPDP